MDQMDDIFNEIKQYDIELISKTIPIPNKIPNKIFIKYRNSNIINLCLIMLCENYDEDYHNLLDNVNFCDVSYYAINNIVHLTHTNYIILNIYLNFCKNCSENKYDKYDHYYLTFSRYINLNSKISFIYRETFESYKKKYTHVVKLDDFINCYQTKILTCKRINLYYQTNTQNIYVNLQY